ncbi:putative bifunctional diguanylate cyclase/phosphodiesterase [Thaumasiovibrio subtropicus]|uniref:putative bifunctional diguanylate cyclase/phosphodiesterase n=1 Tax=Thaumasiovibrio subtropicus TaxID=1891207 RepID=UPI00131C7A05|nr:EAL domain-containing protein [Thaumasiovibrio subtropicus]
MNNQQQGSRISLVAGGVSALWLLVSVILISHYQINTPLAIGVLLFCPSLILFFTYHWRVKRLEASLSHRESEAQQLETLAQRYQALINSLPDLAWIKDDKGQFLAVNEKFGEAFDVEYMSLVGKTDFDISDPHDAETYVREDQQVLETGETVRRVFNARHVDGHYNWIELIKVPVYENGKIIGTAGTARDISERKNAQLKLEFQANYDELTRLPNRASLEKDVNKAISEHKAGELLAVCFLDLDKFKLVNDSMGHIAGDKALTLMAKALRLSVDDRGKVYRLSGDEFVVVFKQLKGMAELNSLVKKLLDASHQTYTISKFEFDLSASMGVSFYPDHGDDCWDLVRAADIAMYEAKQAGRKRYHFFSEEYAGLAFEQLSLEKRLRNALRGDEFFLRFQPIVDVDTNQMTAVEALVRWNEPEVGEQEPASFIPFAEQTGLITDIGDWVLEAAIRQQAQWQSEGIRLVPMSVNVSSLQFFQPDFVSRLATLLDNYELDGDWIELELTESILMKHEKRLISTLQRIRSLGVKLSIDDFGTGYSNLSYLSEYPINKLKIDRTFVDMIDQRPEKVTITKSIIELGRNLNLTVVAEGVERVQEQEAVRDLGCRQIQGYLYSRPIKSEELLDWQDKYAPNYPHASRNA